MINQLIFKSSTIKSRADFFDNQLVCLSSFLWFQLLKCERFLVSFLLCVRKTEYFSVVKQNTKSEDVILGFGKLWSISLHQFIDRTTDGLIEKMTN